MVESHKTVMVRYLNKENVTLTPTKMTDRTK